MCVCLHLYRFCVCCAVCVAGWVDECLMVGWMYSMCGLIWRRWNRFRTLSRDSWRRNYFAALVCFTSRCIHMICICCLCFSENICQSVIFLGEIVLNAWMCVCVCVCVCGHQFSRERRMFAELTLKGLLYLPVAANTILQLRCGTLNIIGYTENEPAITQGFTLKKGNIFVLFIKAIKQNNI